MMAEHHIRVDTSKSKVWEAYNNYVKLLERRRLAKAKQPGE
jgi:hypothetical protein